jgi:hypothetical protein
VAGANNSCCVLEITQTKPPTPKPSSMPRARACSVSINVRVARMGWGHDSCKVVTLCILSGRV